MKNIILWLARLSLTVAIYGAAFCLMIPAAVAAVDDLGQQAGTVNVPAGVTLSEVQNTIVMVLSAREWGIKEKSDGRVVAYLKHRSNEATVTLTYDTTKIDLHCVGWQINKKTGVHEKPEQPTGWMNHIKSDLAKRFIKVRNTIK